MNCQVTCFLLLAAMMATMTAVSGQTFQYSRGWTNGKRSGINFGAGVNELSLIDKLLANPCQLEKLRYILQGKPLNEKLMVPCELLSMGVSENEPENSGMRLRRSAPDFEPRNQENRYNFV